jgi:hypothetical protein
MVTFVNLKKKQIVCMNTYSHFYFFTLSFVNKLYEVAYKIAFFETVSIYTKYETYFLY